jgi:hypothetical protein
VRLRTTTTLLVLAAFAAGCGADEEGTQLPRATVSDLQGQLDSIQARFDFPDGGACDDITSGDDPNTAKVDELIDSLPSNVDADLRDALRDSFDRLFELVDRECAQKTQEPDTGTVTETTPTETETTPTETTPTETTPTETTPTETAPTETIPTETLPDAPPADDGGGGVSPGNGQ